MKKILALFALLPALALGQSYPSPTYNNLTVQGTATLTNNPLAVTSGGTGAASASGTVLDNITGFSSTGFLTRTGAGAYAFQSLTNGISYGNLAQAAANTVLGNATGSTANLSALAVPSCSTSSSALNWTSASGFSCNTAINASSLGGTAASGYLTTAAAASTYAPIASPTLTGTPAAPTASAGTNTTQIATTAFAQNAVTGGGNSGSFTTITASSTITPSQTAGIVGTTTNNNATTGSVGEYVCAQVTNGGSPSGCQSNSSTPISLTTSTAANVTSMSLTAGDWDVSTIVGFVPAGTTVLNNQLGGPGTASATIPPFGQYGQLNVTEGAGFSSLVTSPVVRISIASTTTVYLIGYASFTTSTCTAYGLIRARRVR
jgi:hypothetical protein